MDAVGLAGWFAAIVAALCARGWTKWHRELVDHACHELRGPITAARLAVELGQRSGGLTGDRLEAVGLELGCAELALEDLGCARRGVKTRSELELVDLGSLLYEVAEGWSAAATSWQGTLRVGSVPPGPVLADRRRLAQAISNLVANGLEHGGGVVELAGRLDRDRIRIEVADCGPGLPAPVSELAAGTRRRSGGRGRGLGIASAIAEELGGRLSSAPSERGARLVLELPASPVAAVLRAP